MLFQKCVCCGTVLSEEEIKSLEKLILLNGNINPSCIHCQSKNEKRLLNG